MSLVGNITTSYDRTAASSGAPPYTNTERQQQSLENHDNNNAERNDAEYADSPAALQRVNTLAREMSRRSEAHRSIHGDDANSGDFLVEKDSEMDPFSDKFDVHQWMKKLMGATQDPSKYRQRTAGIAFRNLNVHGFGSDTGYQQTVGTFPLAVIGGIKTLLGKKQRRIDILKGFDGLVEAGEMLVVLGPPGSGCSTLLKTIAGETHGIYVDKESQINYQGISPKQMNRNYMGEVLYTAESDIHFPSLTVGDTLAFAAQARASKNPPPGFTRADFATHMRDVIMSILGISHTINTKVGNEYVRGVSGGERKRVSIAEAMLSQAPLTAWDNSTRGLDSSNAVEFCRTLRTASKYGGSTACVAIYQSPQSAYDLFDKVVVLYEGYQIYFGPAKAAKGFFVDMGFHCPDQQSVPDFLTSLTSPAERTARKGFEQSVPKTAFEFNQRWRESDTYKQLLVDIEEYNNTRFPLNGAAHEAFLASRRIQQSKHTRAGSPFTLSYGEQVKLCLKRGFWRLKADPSLTVSQLGGNITMAFIVSSVYYNLPVNTGSFYSRGGLLFFAVLLNAFGSALEILTLYAQRPIVEKHERYAFYHPSAEAFASVICDLPYKIVNAIFFNLIIYFMTNLRREPGAFFFFFFVSFLTTLAMSFFFRSLAALSRSLVQALTPAAGIILGLVLYSGFALPQPYMLGWISWFRYLNPVYFAFESLMINEFHGRDYPCSSFVPSGPGYNGVAADEYVCSAVGSVAGVSYVSGETYINSAYEYYYIHKWRNVGIVIAFIVGLAAVYLGATETIKGQKSKGEIIIFPRGKTPSFGPSDEESQGTTVREEEHSGAKGKPGAMIEKQTAVFHWQDVTYDVQIKDETRRILDHVDGWVKPGTLTALMGVSGAGKTTLLDCLATRVTMGVLTGEMLIDGAQRDESFQRKTGYCQQQDVHLSTATVRESLEFSALLRQPRHIPKAEKLAYVDEVLALLEMETYADAIVGNLGEGLNVEQRKRLTIGVELAAKPQLLLFLDEPTSGLDSQTSWSILDLLTKLSDLGQAVLCTIHQPSALLFERFDRLLFLQKGGKTVYFDEVGKGSEKLISYFERNGGLKYTQGENPAEWMLSVIGAAPGSRSDTDWHKTWLESPERAAVREELARLKAERPSHSTVNKEDDPNAYKEFAAPFWTQYRLVQTRVFGQLWRSPVYIFSKMALVSIVGLFIGFSLFRADNTQQGMQNQLFSIFLLFTVFGQLVQQIMPHFVTQRALYEVRERPAKTYSWKVFMLSNIVVELPWNTLAAVILFFCWYYPIGLFNNAAVTGATHIRGFQMFLMVWAFMMFTSTFAHFVIAALPTAETGGNLANVGFSLTLIFCGVLVTKSSLGWWIWMYYLSPFHYLAEGMLTTGIANAAVTCAANEYLSFNPPNGETCAIYMATYISEVGGYLANGAATSNCQYCQLASTNVFLAQFQMYYSNAWRDFGIMMIFCVFNAFAAVGIYYWARVPKKVKAGKASGGTDTPPNEKNGKAGKIEKQSSA